MSHNLKFTQESMKPNWELQGVKVQMKKLNVYGFFLEPYVFLVFLHDYCCHYCCCYICYFYFYIVLLMIDVKKIFLFFTRAV